MYTTFFQEFEDTLKYIASIRLKAEPFGICRIVPPPSWKPPCSLKEKTIWEGSTFATRVQRIDKLQNRDSMRKMSKISNHSRKKRRRCMRMAGDCGIDSGGISGFSDVGVCEAERFGFEPGPEFTLNTFQKYADDFKVQYFRKNDYILNEGSNMPMLQENWEPTVENIEGEYWRIVEKATEEIEVVLTVLKNIEFFLLKFFLFHVIFLYTISFLSLSHKMSGKVN